MSVFFFYPVKSDLCTLDKALFPMYQENTTMFNWSPCRLHLETKQIPTVSLSLCLSARQGERGKICEFDLRDENLPNPDRHWTRWTT